MSESTLTEEEQRRAWGLVRVCDAYNLLAVLLEKADEGAIDFGPFGGEFSDEDRQNARDVLWVQGTLAHIRLSKFKREHGIPEQL
jgi:hypothetical protein